MQSTLKEFEKTNFDLEFSFLFAKSVGRGQSHRKLVTGTGMPTSPIYKKTWLKSRLKIIDSWKMQRLFFLDYVEIENNSCIKLQF